MLSIIVAADENNVIGKDNDLIWHLPDDLKFFKKRTTGHTVVMGRKTYESIGKPLPNRRFVIITRNKNYKVEGCEVVHSLEDALNLCPPEDESFVIGGDQIYRLALPHVDRIYLTRVHHQYDGDRYFPELGSNWKEFESEFHHADDKHEVSFTFKTLERV